LRQDSVFGPAVEIDLGTPKECQRQADWKPSKFEPADWLDLGCRPAALAGWANIGLDISRPLAPFQLILGFGYGVDWRATTRLAILLPINYDWEVAKTSLIMASLFSFDHGPSQNEYGCFSPDDVHCNAELSLQLPWFL